MATPAKCDRSIKQAILNDIEWYRHVNMVSGSLHPLAIHTVSNMTFLLYLRKYHYNMASKPHLGPK